MCVCEPCPTSHLSSPRVNTTVKTKTEILGVQKFKTKERRELLCSREMSSVAVLLSVVLAAADLTFLSLKRGLKQEIVYRLTSLSTQLFCSVEIILCMFLFTD